MKKIFLILLILLMVGCGVVDDEETKRIEKLINDPPKEEEKIPEYVDVNPIKVGLYKNGKLVKSPYKNKFSDKKDIAVFNIYYTNVDNVGSDSIKNTWYKYYNKYTNIEDYKTGFYISFETKEKKYESLIKDPSKQHDLHPYLYYYLYDGVHSTGYYSHLLMKDLNENTIYSTIKVYIHQKTSEITSPITLTVFTYKDDNDFLDGYYRGNSYYTIEITNN